MTNCSRSPTARQGHLPAGRAAALVLGLLFVLTALLQPARPAQAHAIFESATPAPGARLSAAPAQIRIVFSEPLNAGESGIELLASSGSRVPARSAGADPADNRAYTVMLPPLAPDVYTVAWHTVSLVDGHERRGAYSFTVLEPDGAAPAAQRPAAAPGEPLQLPGAASAATHWLALLGYFLLAGTALFMLIDGASAAATSERRRTIMLGVGLLLLGGAGELFAQWLPHGSLSGAGAVAGSRSGEWWLLRMAVALALLPICAGRPPRRLTRIARWLAAGAVLSIGAGFAATSHGAASADPWWGAAFDFVHLIAAAIWIGGAIVLAPALRRAHRAGEPGRVACLVKRFSLAAGAAVPVVLLSGLASAAVELHDPGDLLRGGYGRALLIKVLLAGAVLALAAANALVLRRAFLARTATGRLFPPGVIAEGSAGLLVLVAAAAMTLYAPSRAVDAAHAAAGRFAADPNPAASFTANLRLGGHPATLSLTPATLGANAARLEVEGGSDGRGATLTLTSPSGQSSTAFLPSTGTEPGGNAIYQGPLNLRGVAGEWHATIALQRGSNSAAVAVSIAPAATDHAIAGPAPSWLLALALLSGAAALLALTRAPLTRAVRGGALGLCGGVLTAAVVVSAVTAMRAPSASPSGAWGRTARVQATIQAGLQSWAIPTAHAGLMIPAVGPDGAVWIGEMDTNKLARLDPTTGAVQEFSFGGVYQGTMGVAVDAGNHVWLAQQSAGVLGLFDPATGAYQAFTPPTARPAPSGIALAPDGAVWLTEMTADQIVRFDPGTRLFREFRLPTADAAPYWLTVAADGRVWFSELSGLRIGVLDPASGRVTEYTTPNAEHPVGIAAGANGLVWFVTTEGSVVRVEPASGAMTATRAPEAGLYGVAIGADGTVWIGSANGNAVLAYGPATGRFVMHAVPAGSGPWWPAVGEDGSVWVALAGQPTGALARLQAPPAAAPALNRLR